MIILYRLSFLFICKTIKLQTSSFKHSLKISCKIIMQPVVMSKHTKIMSDPKAAIKDILISHIQYVEWSYWETQSGNYRQRLKVVTYNYNGTKKTLTDEGCFFEMWRGVCTRLSKLIYYRMRVSFAGLPKPTVCHLFSVGLWRYRMFAAWNSIFWRKQTLKW